MSESLLNMEYINNLRDEAFGPEGADDFKELLMVYINESEKNVPQIEAALAGKNWEESIRLVHSLKGASRNVGATEVAALCQETEVSLKTGSYTEESLKTFLEQLKVKVSATQQEFKDKFEL